jgi:hypothetical protein
LLQCGELICWLPAMQISRLAAEDEGAADFGGPLIFAACCAPREGPLGVSPMPDKRAGFLHREIVELDPSPMSALGQ